MYDDPVYAKAFEGYTKKRAEFNTMVVGMGEVMYGLVQHMQTMEAVSKDGHILIDIDGDEWESDISERTLEKMKLADIKFPFPSGCVLDSKTDSGFVLFSMKDDLFNVSFEVEDENGGRGVMSQRIDINQTLESAVESFKDNAGALYRTISVLMYIATFRREKARVRDSVSNKLKGSKKRSVPSHKIHTIYVKQPIGGTNNSGSSGGKSEMSWRVKGHWRNQWYAKTEENKPKWIDSYWKGDGKDKIEKIYKVTKE